MAARTTLDVIFRGERRWYLFYGRTDGWMDQWVNGPMSGWKFRRMIGQVEGRWEG